MVGPPGASVIFRRTFWAVTGAKVMRRFVPIFVPLAKVFHFPPGSDLTKDFIQRSFEHGAFPYFNDISALVTVISYPGPFSVQRSAGPVMQRCR